MTREWVGQTEAAGWVMRCDTITCKTRSDVRRRQNDLPLEEFQAKGWFIAKLFGDKCPDCLSDMEKKGWLPDPEKEYGYKSPKKQEETKESCVL